jgi:hypothetical protein
MGIPLLDLAIDDVESNHPMASAKPRSAGWRIPALSPSPPAEKATARQDQARQSSTGDGRGHVHRHKVRRHVCYDFSFMGATNPKPIGCRATVVPSIRSWRCRLSPGLSNLVRALATSE